MGARRRRRAMRRRALRAMRLRVAALWPPSRGMVSLLLTVALILGMAAACLVLLDIGDAVLRALPALPPAIAVHLVQIVAMAMAWRALFHAPRPGLLLMMRARWIRQSLNGLLPLVGIGGGVLAATAVARQTRQPFAAVAAGATVDLMTEAVAQAPFLLVGLALLALVAPGLLAVAEAGALMLPIALGAATGLAILLGPGRAPVLWLMRRIGLGEKFGALLASFAAVNAGPGPLALGVAWHVLAWSLGAFEVWIILALLGTPVSLAEAYVIESLGLAARSLGFVVPGGLGAQEMGLTAVGVALGVPLEEAVAMSLLKRLREVVVSVPGLVAWQWIERRAAAAGEATEPAAQGAPPQPAPGPRA